LRVFPLRRKDAKVIPRLILPRDAGRIEVGVELSAAVERLERFELFYALGE
jgi:hypothetical protein